MTDTTEQSQNAPAESAGNSSPQAESQVSQVEAIMAFDPFGPASPAETGSDETGTTEGAGEGGEEGTEQPAPVDPKAAPAAPTTPTQTGPTKREQELEAQVVALQRAIQQGQQPTTKKDEKPEGGKPQPKYNLGLPPQILNGLRSEDENEFAVAMHAVLNGFANRVWADVQEYISKEVAPQFDQRVQHVMTQGNTVKQVGTDFYGAYPHLKSPLIVPIVQQAAMQVAETWARSGKPIAWGPEFMNEVAALVHTVVPQPQQQQQQQQQQPQPKPKQPFAAKPGTRTAPSQPNQFADVLR